MQWLTGNVDTILWLLASVALFVVEGVTVTLVCIWFAIGALLAMVVAAIGLPVWFQALVFAASSGVLLVATKPFVKKFRVKKVEHTNADRVIGQRGVVTQEINNVLGQGLVKIAGQDWTARAVDDAVIAPGERVEVVDISGVKAIVRRVKQ